MSWEWAAIICVTVISLTAFGCQSLHFIKTDLIPCEFKEIKAAVEKVVSVQNAITADAIEDKRVRTELKEMAEETKKMLSQSQLVAGFKTRGQR